MTDSFEQLADDIQQNVGFKLFTVLRVVPPDVERIYTNMPEAFPLSGRKQMESTPWGDHVIDGGRIWLGRTKKDLQTVFSDHELIASVGCGCCINIPALHEGATLGSLNMLDAEHVYTEAHVEKAAQFAERARALFQLHADERATKG